MNSNLYNLIEIEYLNKFIENKFNCIYCLNNKYTYCFACMYIHGAIFDLANLNLIY